MVELLPSMYEVLGSITSTALQKRDQIIHKYKHFNMLLLEKMVYIQKISIQNTKTDHHQIMTWGQGWRDAQENTCYFVGDPGLISNTYMVAQNCL